MSGSDMSGKTVVITGGNSGIGTETAVALAGAGARVVITARDQARGEAAVADIRSRSGNQGVDLVVFDLASLVSTEAGASALIDRCPRIDVLVNNAGVVLSDRSETVDGFESTFAINHLGPFLLTQRLLERVIGSGPSRIVNVSSTAHRSARHGMDFDDLQSTKRYSTMQVYGQSKLANILFTTELARRLKGTNTTANSLHPGVVATGYGRDGDTHGFLTFGLKLIKPFVLTAAKGARTSVYVASSPEVADISGAYFIKCKQRQTSKAGQDAEAAARLWAASEELIAAAMPSVGDQ
ncbi:MAG TPA: SDR family oxidoreductase [Acidimicrobiales bacterium]|nr:SDR family oxidoreductase [Acidimicrobiales bacterium]